MAGLNYYDNRNKVESNFLKTVYSYDAVDGFPNIKKITRTRTKNYYFVGLNKATAKQCVADKTELYTRTFHNWIVQSSRWKQSTDTYKECVAAIEASKQEGELWEVQIQVNEIAIIYDDPRYITDIEQRFTYFGFGWQYDED